MLWAAAVPATVAVTAEIRAPRIVASRFRPRRLPAGRLGGGTGSVGSPLAGMGNQ